MSAPAQRSGARGSSGALVALVALVALGCGARVTPAALDAPEPARAAFTVVPLGTQGGLDEGDLTAYLLSARGDERGVALDAGTLRAGLRVAWQRGAFGAPVPEPDPGLLRATLAGRVRAVLLSHAHLDHVAGLALNAPDDGPRRVYGAATTLDALRDHLFNGRVWPNFLDEGAPPRLGLYHPVRLDEGASVAVDGTPFTVRAYPLAHGGDGGSTAFLLEARGAQVLYLGDTGPDAVEGGARLATLWQGVGPLLRAGTLRAVFLECSYADPRAPERLYGHLTPRWLRAELDALAQHAGGALAGLAVVVTHTKAEQSAEGTAHARVRAQLGEGYRGARFVYPAQGVRFAL